MTAEVGRTIEAVLVTAKQAELMYAVKVKQLRALRVEVTMPEANRPVGRVRAIPKGERGWLYVAKDIPLALAEDAMERRDRRERKDGELRRAG